MFKRNIYPVYVLKHRSNPEKHVVLLVIQNGEGSHHFPLKHLSALLREITSKNPVIFIVWTVFILLKQKENVNFTKIYVKIKFYVTL